VYSLRWAVRTRIALSLFWFAYFGSVGVFFPYIALYLTEDLGLSSVQVGLVLALMPLLGVIAQPGWGLVADRTGARTRVLMVVTAGAALGYALLGRAVTYPQVLVTTVVLALFMNAVVPNAIAVSLAALRGLGASAYGRVRLWGTVGFGIMVVSFPYLTGATDGRSTGLQPMFPLAAVLALIAAVVAIALPRDGAIALRAERGDWWLLLRHGPVVRLCLFAFLAFFFLHGPMVLFPVYLRSLGGDTATVGRMWVPMLMVEIVLFFGAGTSVRRLGARGLLALGAAAGGVRWLVCGLTDDLALVYPVQLLHGVVVTGILLGGPLYLEQAVPERLRSSAQSVFSVASIALGGALSSAVCGLLMEELGPRSPYAVAGLGAIALAVAVPWLLPVAERGRFPGERERACQGSADV